MSPTQRSLAFARSNGWTCGITEKWNQYAKIRQDLFGCIDLIVLDDTGGGVLGVQACAGASHATRRTKALAEPRLFRWLKQPARFEVWSWAKQGPRGKRKVWTLRREALTLAEHQPQPQDPQGDLLGPVNSSTGTGERERDLGEREPAAP